MYYTWTIFQKKLFFILAIGLLLSFVFNSIMSNHLKVEKRKISSYNYVNKKHKKIIWILNIIFVIILMIYLFYIVNASYNDNLFWRIFPNIILLISLVISELTRAFMEWKYAENRKAYMLTISQLIFDSVLLGIIFTSSFWLF